MINKMLFSVLILLIILIAFSCQSPADIEDSNNLQTGLYENVEPAEETIETDEMVAEPDIIHQKPEIDEKIAEADENNAIVQPTEITEKPETVEEIAEAGKQVTAAVHDGPAVIFENNYIIQVGAYKNINYTNDMLEKLKALNVCAYIKRENNFSKVRIAGIRTKEEAAFIIKEISDKFNINPFLFNAHKALTGEKSSQ